MITITENDFLWMLSWMDYAQATVMFAKYQIVGAAWCNYCSGYRLPHKHIQDDK